MTSPDEFLTICGACFHETSVLSCFPRRPHPGEQVLGVDYQYGLPLEDRLCLRCGKGPITMKIDRTRTKDEVYADLGARFAAAGVFDEDEDE